MDMRHCKSCDEFHPVSEFYEGRRVCKTHDRILKNKRYQDNKAVQSQKIRAARFHLSVDEMNEILSTGCLICGTMENLAVDHDHTCCPRRGYSCGKCIRGALCRNHNRGLGYFDDNVEALQAAINYLRGETDA